MQRYTGKISARFDGLNDGDFNCRPQLTSIARNIARRSGLAREQLFSSPPSGDSHWIPRPEAKVEDDDAEEYELSQRYGRENRFAIDIRDSVPLLTAAVATEFV